MRTNFIFWRTALAVAATVLLSSCLDIISDMRISDDGSGSLAMQYSISKALLHLGTTDEESRFYALPVSREDFEKTADDIEGLTLSSFNLNEEVDIIVVEAEVSFDSIESLSGFFAATGPGSVELVTDGGSTTYKQMLFSGPGTEIDGESEKLIETFFQGFSASFSFRAPGDVLSVSAGTFSGRTARVEFEIPEVVLSPEPVIWEVHW